MELCGVLLIYDCCFILLLGELMSGTAGVGFTPHVIAVAAGEVWHSPLSSYFC